jgi:hypothetical protein
MNQNKYLEESKDNLTTVTKSYSITFNSALATPLNAATFNNKFKVVLNNGIGVPINSKSCRVGLVSANIWNFDSNIREPVNKIYFEYDGNPETSITIPNGYYGITELNEQIKLQLNLGGFPTDLFTFSGDQATQKVVVNFNATNIRLNFNPDDSIFEILGMDQRYSPAGGFANAGDVDLGDNVANFNSVNEFLIECGSIVNDGIPIGQVGTSIIGKVGITAPPNSLISASPNQVLWVDCSHLIGSNRTDITWTLKNELLEDVTVIDNFDWTVTIEWTIME